MPADSITDLKEYTDKIGVALAEGDAAQLLTELLNFGKLIAEHFPDKKSEEIRDELFKSGMALPSYALEDAGIINLGAMARIATDYYSNHEDEINQLLSDGDDRFYRTYQAWKNAIVIFSYLIEKGEQTDLFIGLKKEVEKKIDTWSLVVLGQFKGIVEGLSNEKKHAQSTLQMVAQQARELEQTEAQQKVAALQSVFEQYKTLISTELKKAVLALPR